MPRGDRTGPGGMGSMTGRGAGFCSGNNSPGFTSSFGGGRGAFRGPGRGFGRGMGYGFRNYGPDVNQFYPAQPQNEAKLLEQQASILEDQLQGIKTRLEDLEKSKK